MTTSEHSSRSIADRAVQQLLYSPRLPQVVEQFEAVLRLEREKRQQFYDQVNEQQKAEFIHGEVIVQTPAKMRHITASDQLFTLMHTYVQQKRLGYVGHEKLLITLPRNDYEPDICYFGAAKSRSFTPGQTKFPAPDLVVEILSPTTEAVDRGVKFEDYALNGVAEYWIVDPEAEFIEQYLLGGETFELLIKARSGLIHSITLQGFEIPVRAIFDVDEHLVALKEMFSG